MRTAVYYAGTGPAFSLAESACSCKIKLLVTSTNKSVVFYYILVMVLILVIIRRIALAAQAIPPIQIHLCIKWSVVCDVHAPCLNCLTDSNEIC